MRLATTLRLIVYVATIAVLTVAFKWLFSTSRLRQSSIHRQTDDDKFPEWSEFCRPIVRGAEALLHGDDYRLEAVFLLTRHGLRAPLVTLDPSDSTNGCGLRNEEAEIFKGFQNCMEKNVEMPFLNISDRLLNIPMYPSSNDCQAGELTKSGVVQMIELGRWYRHQYASLFKRPGFNGVTAAAINVITTKYSRTFQSALGFLYGLATVSPQSTCPHKSPVKFSLQPSVTTHFCLDPTSCRCGKIATLHDEFHAEQTAKSDDIGGVRLKGIMRKSLKLLGLDENSGIVPQQLFDLLTGGFVCRNAPLPCDSDGNCVTKEDLEEVESVLKRRNTEMFNNQPFKAMSVGESYFFLQEILSRIHSLIKGNNPEAKRFHYFSGHDISIRPLLRSLEIKDSNQIAFSSRLVFELYRQTMSEKRFLRILYNGEDIGTRVPFCRKYVEFNAAICPLEEFEQFVGTSLLRGVGASNIRQFCGI